MEIKHKETETKGSFYVGDDPINAEMTYSKAGDSLIIIDHTEVGEALKGKGVGLQLVQAAVEYARKHRLKILPLCPFAKSVFEKKEALRDVL
ncbi:MAG TPA: GNAT family N-acetyltransferase [Cytophagales bacterium]|nr:GNAT family N-acetyltransferase [Cytophagales bacterium]HCR54591.1 GNAT family N-acetyltransferase [Cytophagales bacterium]